MEDSCHPQHPEDDHAGQEEKGQDRQQVDNSVEGDQDPQPVFHTEDENRNDLDHMKKRKQKRKLVKGL